MTILFYYTVSAEVRTQFTPSNLLHETPTSSVCWQFVTPQTECLQYDRRYSLPRQATSSSHITPVPPLKYALLYAVAYVVVSPSWRQTTRASVLEKLSSHTVPHAPLKSRSNVNHTFLLLLCNSTCGRFQRDRLNLKIHQQVEHCRRAFLTIHLQRISGIIYTSKVTM